DANAMHGTLPLMLGISLAGLSSLARLAAPAPDPPFTLQTRMAGMGLNVLRVALVGAAMLGSYKAGLGILVAAVAGAGAWILLDQILVGPVLSKVEDREVSSIWQDVPLTGKAIFALAP